MRAGFPAPHQADSGIDSSLLVQIRDASRLRLPLQTYLNVVMLPQMPGFVYAESRIPDGSQGRPG